MGLGGGRILDIFLTPRAEIDRRASWLPCSSGSPEAASRPGLDLGVVVDELLRDGSTETAAALGSVLERAALRIGRDGGDASFLETFRDRVALELSERVRRDSEVRDQRIEQSLGMKMLEALSERDCSPSELAGLLDVDLTQISRAGRVLAASGEMVIEVDPRDKRRRLYQAKSRISRYVSPARSCPRPF